jgi:hypothetical protein
VSAVLAAEHMPDLSAGLCRNRLAEFEDINTLTAARAAQICRSGCPVLAACRKWGVRRERYGMWGGLGERGLKAERKRLGIELDEIRTASYAPRGHGKEGA